MKKTNADMKAKVVAAEKASLEVQRIRDALKDEEKHSKTLES